MSTIKQYERKQTVEELLTLQELTDALKIKPGWVYQHIHAGTLPFPYCKIGAFLRFPVTGIQRYIESQMCGRV